MGAVECCEAVKYDRSCSVMCGWDGAWWWRPCVGDALDELAVDGDWCRKEKLGCEEYGD